MAPNNAFSWHVCAAYHTFTMAKMSPQFSYVNRHPWKALERQVLYWAVTEGPIYIITGPVFRTFPSNHFDYINEEQIDSSQIYERNRLLMKKVDDELIAVEPEIKVPTGYFKVIYKPASNTEPAEAAGFLLPHTQEKYKVFWPFISRIDLIQEITGITFSGIEEELKGKGHQYYWLEREAPSGWGLRKDCNFNFNPSGLLTDAIREERLAACVIQ